jgi:hypothetical protein
MDGQPPKAMKRKATIRNNQGRLQGATEFYNVEGYVL